MPPTVSAGFFSATYYPVEQLKAELSFSYGIYVTEPESEFLSAISIELPLGRYYVFGNHWTLYAITGE